jgi:hypothetical protein
VLALGPTASDVFGRLGIDPARLAGGRRPLARACLDWTERRPHLGGSLGTAVWRRMLELGWVVGQPGSRIVVVTAMGRQQLEQVLGVGGWQS